MAPPTRQALSRKERVDALLAVSGQHLERVKQLSDREWKTDVLYWTLTLISGSGLITYCAKPDSMLAPVVAQHDWLVIVGYGIPAAIYLLAMAGNKHRSLVTERNRYQLTQDTALRVGRIPGFRLTNADPKLPHERDARWWTSASKIRLGFGPIKKRRVLTSSVWGAKVIASWAMVSAIWFLSQTTAHYVSERQFHERMVASALTALSTRGLPASTSVPSDTSLNRALFNPEEVDFVCAFLTCQHRSAPAFEQWPRQAEPGVWCWLAFTIVFLVLGVHAMWRGSV